MDYFFRIFGKPNLKYFLFINLLDPDFYTSLALDRKYNVDEF